MCGRFTLTSPLEALKELFGFVERPNLQPRANIAPTQDVLVVRLGEDGERHAVSLRWGLLPPWAKDRKIGARFINARSETVATQSAFRKAFAARRCLIAADGFYEWQVREAGKQPFRICRGDGAPFAFAGLWERWHDPQEPREAPAVESCTILTTDANDLLRPIHHRMPVILPPAAQAAWLAPDAGPAALQALLTPLDPAGWRAYPVSPRVNKVANDDLSLLEEVEPGAAAPPPRQQSLF
ncbi:Putative SOS response-associated peptidase YedK [Tistlia consotensis]|uniref:Abasic site processing protein n=1 Tax=Tistlia consotensis USBA 355 TaxID=560819 RepID=A0A1Y6CNC2_9PROT|nr:SOS response-associated peptidase [Tistlia consotensis]SMF79538.1 Putative SOS response-associated peptidase YedK [Tistlia consotensis USBA 355]SNS17036.1 Putative SOS response-associated peptidase YedK [Tistlia consotensis]